MPLWQIIAIIVALIMAIAFVATVLFDDGADNTASVAPSPTKPWPTLAATKTPTVTPSPTATASPTPTPTPRVIISHIQALGRLETMQYVMQTVVDLENEPNTLWQRVFGTDKILLIANGEVLAGFDLSKMEADDIAVQGDSVVLTLPAPEIFLTRVDNEETTVYLRETGFLVKPDPSLETDQWAQSRDILGKAEASGWLYLENFLQSLGFADIIINIRTSP